MGGQRMNKTLILENSCVMQEQISAL